MEEAQETQISPRHQKHEEEEEEEEDDDDDENPNVEEDLAERDYDSEDQTHQNHPSSQPHMETEVLSDHDIRISQLLVVIKCSLNRLHSSVTAIVPAVVLPGILEGDKSDSLLYDSVDNGKKICWNEDFHSKWISKREDVYLVIKAFAVSGEWMNAEAKRFVQILDTFTNASLSSLSFNTCVNYFVFPDEPLHLVQILLVAGADPYAQDSQHGWTTLHTAVMTDDVELVKVILVAGVDVNIRNMHNGIPLHIALARGAKSCVELLLSIGANCNVQLRSIPKLLWTKFVSLDVVFQLVAEDAKAVGASWIIGIDIDSNRFERVY
ncbi:hypothetical protein JHK86_012376 [Glycine max]|nr:hypothetical protein JHK86_012376 [Glycine max]